MSPAAAFKATEMFDLNALKTIISNWDVLPIDQESKKTYTIGRKTYEPIKMLNDYYYGAKHNKTKAFATFSTLYHYSENAKDEGRRYVKGGRGLQMFSRSIRHTLAHRFYDDIDIKNCHPVILLQYCEKKGYDVTHIKKYVQKRDEKLAQLMSQNNISKDQAKKVVLAILNGGVADFNALANKPAWLTNFKIQVDTIQELIVNDKDNERFVKRAKKDNKAGSTMNHILCAIEDSLLSAAIKFLQSKRIDIGHIVLAFDGFMLPKNSANLTEEFLVEMASFVATATTYNVEFAIKHMDEVIDLEGFQPSEFMESNNRVVEDDNEAANVFIEQYGDIMKKSNGRVFVYNYNNTWCSDPSIVDCVLLDTCLNSKIYKQDTKGNPKPYSGNVSGAKHVIEAVKAKLRDDPNFSKTLWSGSIGKVFFADGYYDFKNSAFVSSVKPDDSLTTIRLSYSFPERDENMINEVRENVLNSIFPNPDVRDTFMAHIARGVAGDYEGKDWCVGIGERNSGKGVLVGLNEIHLKNIV